MKVLLPFLLWLAPCLALQAADGSFWRHFQLQSACSIQADRYKVHISGLHPGIQNGVMHVNDPMTQSYLIRWYHAPSIYFEQDNYQTNGDYTKNIFGFTGQGMTLAAQFLVAMDLRQLRIGGGAGIRCSFLQEMVGQWVSNNPPNGEQDKENNPLYYIPTHSYYFTWTPLLRLGFKLIENQSYTLLIDGTWAPCIYSFSELGQHYYWVYERNFDVGSTWEKQLTHYVHWNLRVAYGFCLNNNEPIEHPSDDPSDHKSPNQLTSISHYINSIIAQVGINIRIPGLSKCPIRECKIKADHIHSGKHYRGDTLFTSL